MNYCGHCRGRMQGCPAILNEYEEEPSKYNVLTAPMPVVVHFEEGAQEKKKLILYIFNRLLESLLLAFSGNYVCTHHVSYPLTHVALSPERDRNNAQSSCAGLFVGAHLGFDYPGIWIHVDMAAPVHFGERATGYGVALLLTLFGNHTNCSMLQEIASNDSEPPTKRVCRD
ncbi:hypothetical protein GQX74_006731 [Glossina fuscipes]|nr:hypothetical protein GQX74_006731 [Glossina fuscipes]